MTKAICASFTAPALGSHAALAQPAHMVTVQEIAHACASDIDRLCPGVPPGQGRIKACMKAHMTELSAPGFGTLLSAVRVMYTLNSDMLFPPDGW